MKGVRVTRSTRECRTPLLQNIGSTRTRNTPACIVITIDNANHESTPLLTARWCNRATEYNSCKNQEAKIAKDEYIDISSNEDLKEPIWEVEEDVKFVWEYRLIALLIFIAMSFAIAIYMLAIETRLPYMNVPLELVNHDIWSKMAIPMQNALNSTDVENIMLMHTGGESCSKPQLCLTVLEEMQKEYDNQLEMPYNFLIGGDGQTYEVRGWNHQSGLSVIPQYKSLVIGIIGNYTKYLPSNVQLQSALALISESIRRRKLQSQYQIYGLRNLTISHMDAEALLNKIAQWSRFNAIVHLL